MSPDLSVFSGRRVLITGHTGFKGSWLYKILDIAGATLDGFSLEPASNAHILGLKLRNKISDLHFGDIRSFEQIRKKIDDFQPEVIFHLAAQPLVRVSYRQTRETYETNFMGGVNLLESVRHSASLKSLVFITSDKAYENQEWEWGYRETDALGGKDPYSASKGAIEIAFSSYSRTILSDSNFGCVTARAGNVIGGGDWSEDRIIPDLVRSHLAGEKLILRNPHSTRPWQHVLEPLSGYLLLARAMLENRKLKESYNFGPNFLSSYTVLQLVEGVAKSLGNCQVVLDDSGNHLDEARLLQLNCDRARTDLGWSPKWNFDQTVEKTAIWYKKYLEQKDVNDTTERQITDYFGI